MRWMLCSLVVLPVWAWAVGCSDEIPADPADAGSDDGTPGVDAPSSPDDSGKCAKDLDADGISKHLECSGLYSSFADKAIAGDVKPYKPGVEFWSDGAEKHRWVYLPPGQKIDISDFDEWTFPAGTKVWKEFKLGGKRIETRFYTKLPDQTWVHTTYRWNADETDAVRMDGGESLAGLGPDGGAYEIPSTGECDQCHRGRKDSLLGFDAVSLGVSTASGVTLAKLAEEGRLSAAPPKTSLAFPDPAVGWIHTNCGACHNANPGANAGHRAHFLVRGTDLAPMDGGAPATTQELDVWKQAYCKKAFRNEPDGGAAYMYIRGGDPSRSLISVLARARVPPDQLPSNGVQMPPIVTRAVDHAGVELLDDWIRSLEPCPP